MSKLRLIVALAASVALAPMVSAQTVSDPDLASGVPQIGIQSAAAAAQAMPHAARPGAPHAGGMTRGSGAGHWSGRGPVVRPHPGPQPHMAGHPGMRREIRREVRNVRHPGAIRGGGSYHRGRFAHVPRINRGFVVPQFWWGPQFVVHNWSGYGFQQPFAGARWIRYYDDALLIDRSGRVHDGRYGLDWDRYEDRWSTDGNGIPVYVGDGDFEPEERDYEWAERWDRGEIQEDYADRYEEEGYASGPVQQHGPAYGYGLPHGYGAAYGTCACGPVVVTETTVTTPAVVEEVTYYEYETVRSPAPRARAHSKKVKARRVPLAPPHDGEKG